MSYAVNVTSIRRKISYTGAGLLIAALLMIYLLMQQFAVPLVTQQVEHQASNRIQAISNELQRNLQVAETLTQALAALAETLPLDKQQFEQQLPGIIHLFGDTNIAGGGIWPEPGKFQSGINRHSFFWARNSNAGLDLLNDYNDSSGGGYHNEGWYTVGRSLQPGRCAWS